MTIFIVANNRAEKSPLESVMAALPEAKVVGMDRDGQCGPPPWVMAKGLEYFADVLRGASIVILLGDRYETLAAALAATFLRVPIAHIHGGETTTGAFDDAMRHSISLLAHQGGGIHFAATYSAAHKIAELVGEQPGDSETQSRIYTVGAPGLDNIPANSAKRDSNIIVASYYAETMAHDGGLEGCRAMLDALSAVSGYSIFFSSVNSDPGSEKIRWAIQGFINSNPNRALWVTPDTREQYLHLVQHAALVIGNSSAGVIEAPWIGVPSVNIGDRQRGREMAHSVLQADSAVGAAIQHALGWRGGCGAIYQGNAAPKIAAAVREFVAKRSAA